jgi:hypothetical protein
LRHLIDTVASVLLEFDYAATGRDRELERIAALVRIGRDLSDRLSVNVAAIFPKELKPWMK